MSIRSKHGIILLLFLIFTFISFLPHFIYPGKVLNFEGLEYRKRIYHIGKICYRTSYNSNANKESYVVLSRIYSYGVEFQVNGEKVFKIGGFKSSSNMWTTSVVIPVKLKKGENTFDLCLYSYETSIVMIPVVVTDNPWLFSHVIKLFFSFSVGTSTMLIAFSLLFFINTAKVVEKYRRMFVMISFSAVFIFIALSYFIFGVNYSTSKILIFHEKISAIFFAWGIYLNLLVFKMAVNEEFNKKVKGIFLAVMGATSLIVLLMEKCPIYYASLLILQLLPTVAMIFYILRARKYNLKELYYSYLIFSIGMIVYLASSVFSLINYFPVVFGIFYMYGVYLKDVFITFRDFQRMIRYDGLTSAYSRVVLNSLKLNKDDSVVFVDVNDFKKFNDTMGHKAGDKALVNIVDTMKKNLKGKDMVIRYGGDEFVIVLKGCSDENARKIMERISREIRKTYPPGISYGISTSSENLEVLLRRADKNMYMMKRKLKSK